MTSYAGEKELLWCVVTRRRASNSAPSSSTTNSAGTDSARWDCVLMLNFIHLDFLILAGAEFLIRTIRPANRRLRESNTRKKTVIQNARYRRFSIIKLQLPQVCNLGVVHAEHARKFPLLRLDSCQSRYVRRYVGTHRVHMWQAHSGSSCARRTPPPRILLPALTGAIPRDSFLRSDISFCTKLPRPFFVRSFVAESEESISKSSAADMNGNIHLWSGLLIFLETA